MYVAASVAFGGSENTAIARAIFPYALAADPTLLNAPFAVLILSFFQYPLYGIVVAIGCFALRRRAIVVATCVVLIVGAHFAAMHVAHDATRWEWDFQPSAWWMKALGGRHPIPIINVFRFKDGKTVELWNHRHDIDTGFANVKVPTGMLVGLIPSIVLAIISLLLWRRLRKYRAAQTQNAFA